MVECLSYKEEVGGSSPSGPTKMKGNVMEYKEHKCPDRPHDMYEVVFKNGMWFAGYQYDYHFMEVKYCPFCGLELPTEHSSNG